MRKVKKKKGNIRYVNHAYIYNVKNFTVLYFFGTNRDWIRNYEWVDVYVPAEGPLNKIVLKFRDEPSFDSYKLTNRKGTTPYIGFRRIVKMFNIPLGRYRAEYDEENRTVTVYLDQRVDEDVR